MSATENYFSEFQAGGQTYEKHGGGTNRSNDAERSTGVGRASRDVDAT